MIERGADRPGHHDAGGEISGGESVQHRHIVMTLALQRHQAGEPLDDDVVARAVCLRALAAKRRVIAVDQPRVDFGERFVADAELFANVRPVVDQHHVHIGHQPAHYLLRFRLRQVERKAALAAIERDVAAAFGRHELGEEAPGLALRRLDLDHIGAHIGQQHAPERPGDNLREL